jgi:hypothetical protein
MSVDEQDAAAKSLQSLCAGNFGLTISAADLSYTGNHDYFLQGNYDYDAHAQVYWGGADPLGSQGYASVVKKSFQLLDAAREANQLAGVFVSGLDFPRKAIRELSDLRKIRKSLRRSDV